MSVPAQTHPTQLFYNLSREVYIQKVIQIRFGIRLSVHYWQKNPSAEQNSIQTYGIHLFNDPVGYGDLYGGYSYHSWIKLIGFIRPDNQQKLRLSLNYSLHQLSGQHDLWEGEIEGADEEEEELFISLISPFNILLSNYPKLSLQFNGKIL